MSEYKSYPTGVEERATAVSSLVRQSVSSWKEVAKHVKAAKAELSDEDYLDFVKLTGLTGPICDKLCRVAQSDNLYSDEMNKHSGRLEGWTNLYELSKLTNPELDEFVLTLDSDRTVPVTREFIQSFKAGASKPSSSRKQSVVAKIMFSHDEIGRLDLTEFEKLKDMMEQITRAIDAASPVVSILVVNSVIEEFEAQLLSKEIDESELAEYAEKHFIPSSSEAHIEERSFI